MRKRVRGLVASGYLKGRWWSIWLRDTKGRGVASQVWAYSATAKGNRLAGEWAPAGYPDHRLSLNATANASRLSSDHLLGVAALAAHYAQWALIATEREIDAMEIPVSVGRTRRAPRSRPAFTVPVVGQAYGHVPDLGVDWAGNLLAVELERAHKDEIVYSRVIAAYYAAGLAQVWHVQKPRTLKRLVTAASRVGVQWDDRELLGGVRMSTDGRVRVAPWWPGRASVGGPAGWLDGYELDRPPALLPLVPKRDLGAAWRTGVARDPDSEPWAA